MSSPTIDYSFYGSVDDGDTYFSNKLNNYVWINSTPQRKQTSLIEATRIIDRLKFKGIKADSTQILEFPRIYDSAIVSLDNAIFDNTTGQIFITEQPSNNPVFPADILVATYEIAYTLLDGFDIQKEIDGLNVTSRAFEGVKTTYERKILPDYLLAGIPSAYAWNILRPYLKDPYNLTFERVN